MPRISPDLWAAYRATNYAIQRPEGELVVRIGQLNPELEVLLAEQAANSGAYMTAWNPYSKIVAPEHNAAANTLLESILDQAGLRHLPCLGQDPTGQWPAEPGFWILDADRRWLQRIGRRFRQNALVFAGLNGVPRLLSLR